MLVAGWLELCSASPLVREPGRWSHSKPCQPLQQRKRDWDHTHTRPCKTSAQNDFHHTCSHLTGQSKSHGHAERPGPGRCTRTVRWQKTRREREERVPVGTPTTPAIQSTITLLPVTWLSLPAAQNLLSDSQSSLPSWSPQSSTTFWIMW